MSQENRGIKQGSQPSLDEQKSLEEEVRLHTGGEKKQSKWRKWNK